MMNPIFEAQPFLFDANSLQFCPQNNENTLYLVNTPELPLKMCGFGQHELMMKKMYRAFSALNFNVKEISSFDGIEDKETNVFVCCHPTDGVWGGYGHVDFSVFKKYEKSFFVLFAFTSERFECLPINHYILTDFEFKKIGYSHPQSLAYQKCSNFAPTIMASFLLPNEIDLVREHRFVVQREYDCLFIGAPYQTDWLSAISAEPSLKSFIHVYKPLECNFLVGRERIEKFLDSNFSLCFQSDGPAQSGIIPERAFESMSMGLVGITNSQDVSKATNDIVKYVTGASEALAYIKSTKDDQKAFQAIIEAGFDFSKQQGNYLESCKLILSKLIEFGYKLK